MIHNPRDEEELTDSERRELRQKKRDMKKERKQKDRFTEAEKEYRLSQKSQVGFWDEDEFDERVEDPMNANGIEAQLWEILVLQNHGLKQVRDYAKIFCTGFLNGNALPSNELLKITENHFLQSEVEGLNPMTNLNLRDLEDDIGMYPGEDPNEQRLHDEMRTRLLQKDRSLIDPKSSVFTKF